jgi:glycerol-3-phosphate acyltransferase PlsY
MTVRLILSALLGYVIGSFPTGVLLTRALGRPDVCSQGSGHTGGLNTYRQIGLIGGLCTTLVDLGKGVLAAWVAVRLSGTLWSLPLAGAAAVAGHCWSVFIGFSGGMGLSTLAGLFLWQLPLLPVLAACLWGVGFFLLRDRPRAVLIMAVLMVPVFGLCQRLGYLSAPAAMMGLAGLAVVFLRHATELARYDARANR